jgi:predicted RNA-binding Zn-ribbon protein involved in translation (DUF1610 family)
MKRGGRFWCDGRHGGWDEDEGEEDPDGVDAEYFRECASCGREVNVCLYHRPKVFLCPRCFDEQNTLGKDEARLRGRAREKDRQRKRRERRRIYLARPHERLLWTTEELFGG